MKRVIAPNGVVYERSELIPCAHGFSTRLGGVSTLSHTATLNLGFDRGDDAETVRCNLSRFAEAVGFDPTRLISVSQIHSARVRYVTAEHAGEGIDRPTAEPCDGYVTDQPDVVVGIRTADCVPILLYAPPQGAFGGAVAAVHAGWRGTAAGIVRVAVDRLCRLGAEPQTVRAAIGPSIGSCCYEVRQDFADSFRAMAGDGLTERYVLPIPGQPGVYRSDLKGANQELLLSAGLLPENLDCSDSCTMCDPKTFFSHRVSGGLRGSLLSVISTALPKFDESR
ncbi:MAG: peptidoglycan editing factor PgeF [Clostridia bacterium]|nr:peptidoglycan editing factor PgeF [Clostridia bacterium]